MATKEYIIRSHFFMSGRGWVTKEERHLGSYEGAASKASGIAKVLDGIHGDSHHWNVYLINPETNGAYFELFHGRTS